MMDVPSIIDSLLGGKSGTGKILAALARDSGRGTTSIAHLARETRLSETKTLRTVNKLIETGLVVDEHHGLYRHIALNTDSPFHQTVLDMLYLAYGVRQHRDDGFVMGRSMRSEMQVPFVLADLVPDELHPDGSGEDIFDNDHYDGPHAIRARQWERTLASVGRRAGHIEYLLQQSYSSWHDERDRDLVHHVLHCGNGVSYGARVLRHAADRSNIRDGHVGHREWTLAATAARAEAAACRNLASHLEHGVDMAYKRRRKLRTIAEHEARLAQDRPAKLRALGEHSDAEDAERVAEYRREEIAEARESLAQIEEQMRGTYRNGGLGVDLDDVNTAGERMIIAELRDIADAAEAHAAAMDEILQRSQPPVPTLDVPESR